MQTAALPGIKGNQKVQKREKICKNNRKSKKGGDKTGHIPR